MRLRSALALAVLAISAAPEAQPVDRPGVYAVLGSAAPERLLFRDAADPVLTVGYRLSSRADLHAGVRFGTESWVRIPGRPQSGEVLAEVDDPSRFEQRTRTAALAVGMGVRERLGPVEVQSRASVALDLLERSATTDRYGVSDADPTAVTLVRTVAETAATFAHTGLSAAIAVPLRRGVGRIAPGLGLAVTTSSRLGGTVEAPPLQTMAFLDVPTAVAVGAGWVTLDVALGLAKGGQPGAPGTDPWRPILEAGLRVDL